MPSILQVYTSEPQPDARVQMLKNLNALLARLPNLEVLNLQQPVDKVWSENSRHQLLELQHQMQQRSKHPERGPLRSLKHVFMTLDFARQA